MVQKANKTWHQSTTKEKNPSELALTLEIFFHYKSMCKKTYAFLWSKNMPWQSDNPHFSTFFRHFAQLPFRPRGGDIHQAAFRGNLPALRPLDPCGAGERAREGEFVWPGFLGFLFLGFRDGRWKVTTLISKILKFGAQRNLSWLMYFSMLPVFLGCEVSDYSRICSSGKSEIRFREREVAREMSIGASCNTQHEKKSRDNGLWNLEILNLNSDHACS